MTPGDRVSVSVTVEADPATAFALFTEETDLWWRRGPKYRIAGRNPGVLKFEPGVGGRLTESFDTKEFTTGTITVWNPPKPSNSNGAASTSFPGNPPTCRSVLTRYPPARA